MRAWILVLLAAALALAGAPTAVAQGVQGATPQPEYRLGAGDEVAVTVFRHEDLSGAFEVDGAGRIALPLIGQVPVQGLTPGEVEAEIVRRLKPDYLKDPHVSVQVLNYRPFYILGEVREPGSYDYVSGLTVLQAVALAGGFTYRADEDDLLIRRSVEPAGRERAVSGSDPVLPGDVVVVPERFF